MRVVFFGSGAFGLPTLRALRRAHEVVGVLSQPDRPAGRGKQLTPTPIAAAWAAEGGDPVMLLRPEDVNEPSMVERVRALSAEAWVVIAFGQKLGRALLADRFAINLHASLLPRWRGAAPINHAILAGDAETGNSVITLAERMDAGLVLGQSRRPIDPALTAGELHDVLAEDGPDLVLRVLAEQERGVLRAVEQDAAGVTLARKLSKADGWVDFGEGPEACRRRVHGLSPWPGVTVRFRGDALRLTRVEAMESLQPEAEAVAGALVDAETGVVACGSGGLRLLEVQPAGKRVMRWADFARGARLRAGEMLEGGVGGAC